MMYNLEQERAPLFEALLQYLHQSKGNFHVPGHKQGRAFDQEGVPWFHPLLQLDLTEVGKLDDLHDPQGVIQEAQSLAAEVFQADHTLFLVGGTTAGNLATILHLCQPGDPIIVQRNCHQSVFHGCLLAGARPVYLEVEIDPRTGLENAVQPGHLQELIKKVPQAKGVVITSPNYFGLVQPLKELTEICQQYAIPLVVDEAHGGHFGFHPDLPPSAMQCGVDVSIQSTHKMLTSMTMSSMLHLQGNRVQLSEIVRWLRMVESSSPSYPLMASLDLARRYIVREGFVQFDRLLVLLKNFRGNIDSFRHLQEIQFPGIQDPCKFMLRAKENVSGYQLAEWMEKRGYYPELADHEKVLFIFTLGTTATDLENILRLLRELDLEIPTMTLAGKTDTPSFPKYPPTVIGYEELRRSERICLPLEQAVGRIATEMIVPYPPGIPLILPGELFSKEVINYLRAIMDWGGRVRGLHQSSSPHVFVLK